MLFLKIFRNFKFLLIFFCLFSIFFWHTIEEKESIYKCTIEVPIEEKSSNYINKVGNLSIFFESNTKAQLVDNNLSIEKTTNNQDECDATFLTLANNSITKINHGIKVLKTQRLQAIDQEVKGLKEDLESLKTELSRLNQEKEEFQEKHNYTKKQINYIKDSINELELQKEKLLLTYTIDHPEIINISKEIKILQDRLKGMPQVEKSGFLLQEELLSKSNEYQEKKQKLGTLNSEKEEINIDEDVIPVEDVESTTIALQEASGPKHKIVLIFSIICSSFIFILFLIFDKKIYTPEKLKTPNIIAKFPKIKGTNGFFRLPFNNSFLNEKTAFNKIISFLKGKKIVFISSFNKREGKSVFAFSLGVFLAKEGKRAVLVDFNFKNPTLTKNLKGKRQNAFIDKVFKEQNIEKRLFNYASLIIDKPNLEKFIKTNGLDRVSILFAEKERKPNWGEYKKVLIKLKGNYDYVICDCSAFNENFTEIIGEESTLLLMLRKGYAKFSDVEKVAEILNSDKIHNRGVVFNEA